jgi:hypothetical protein
MVFSNLEFPPGLDLLVFSQGATMRGLRTVPLPILKKVGTPTDAGALRGGLWTLQQCAGAHTPLLAVLQGGVPSCLLPCQCYRLSLS